MKRLAGHKKIPLLVICIGITTATVAAALSFYRLGYRAARADLHMSQALKSYYVERTAVLTQQAADFAPGGAVILGDSIVEWQVINSLCGLPTLNAGISGIKTEQLSLSAKRVLSVTKPSLVVIAVGINDTGKADKVPIHQWVAAYRRLLQTVRASRIIIVGVEPLKGKKSQQFDSAMRERQNLLLPKLAREANAAYVAPFDSATGITRDGIHLNVVGARRWRAAIETACSRSS